MKNKTPKRLGLKRNIGNPIHLTYKIIESGKQIKSYHFERSKTPLLRY